MNACCVICSDLFDDLSSISAAPCGHVFHTSCLELWIDNSKTCPQCRTRTYSRIMKKLYFNFLPKSDINYADLESKITSLTAQLNSKDEELGAFKKDRDEVIAFMSDAEDKICRMKYSIRRLVQELKELRVKLKSVAELEAKVLMFEKMNETLSNHTQILTIKNSTLNDVVKDYKKAYSDHLQALITQQEACLKQAEAIKSKDKLDDLNYEQEYEYYTFGAGLRLDEDAIKLPSREFQETTSSNILNPSMNSDEENFFASAVPKVAFSKEKVKMPASMTFNTKAFNMYVQSSGVSYNSASVSQNKLESSATVNGKKYKGISSVIRINYH